MFLGLQICKTTTTLGWGRFCLGYRLARSEKSGDDRHFLPLFLHFLAFLDIQNLVQDGVAASEPVTENAHARLQRFLVFIICGQIFVFQSIRKRIYSCSQKPPALDDVKGAAGRVYLFRGVLLVWVCKSIAVCLYIFVLLCLRFYMARSGNMEWSSWSKEERPRRARKKLYMGRVYLVCG